MNMGRSTGIQHTYHVPSTLWPFFPTVVLEPLKLPLDLLDSKPKHNALQLINISDLLMIQSCCEMVQSKKLTTLWSVLLGGLFFLLLWILLREKTGDAETINILISTVTVITFKTTLLLLIIKQLTFWCMDRHVFWWYPTKRYFWCRVILID